MSLTTCRLIVVRHSERLDEVDETAWKKLVTKNTAARGRKSFSSDPIISPGHGADYAAQAAQVLKDIISREAPGCAVNVYASRLLRATQTASFIAVALGVPVHLSAGLAQIIPAVKNSKGTFEFASDRELSQYCEPVTFVNTDDPRNTNYLPTNSWKAALQYIISQPQACDTIHIVVGHRETIRKLVGEYLQTPYCCMGMFRIRNQPPPLPVSQHTVVSAGPHATIDISSSPAEAIAATAISSVTAEDVPTVATKKVGNPKSVKTESSVPARSRTSTHAVVTGARSATTTGSSGAALSKNNTNVTKVSAAGSSGAVGTKEAVVYQEHLYTAAAVVKNTCIPSKPTNSVPSTSKTGAASISPRLSVRNNSVTTKSGVVPEVADVPMTDLLELVVVLDRDGTVVDQTKPSRGK